MRYTLRSRRDNGREDNLREGFFIHFSRTRINSYYENASLPPSVILPVRVNFCPARVNHETPFLSPSVIVTVRIHPYPALVNLFRKSCPLYRRSRCPGSCMLFRMEALLRDVREVGGPSWNVVDIGREV